MTSLPTDARICQWFPLLASAVDRRSAPRLALLFLGAVLARGRRTVTNWIRAAGLSTQFRSCYTAVAAVGKKADKVATQLLVAVIKPLVNQSERLTLALDDTPTPRYGPHVQGAGIHHNPTPGPAGSPHVYGHVFVVLGLLITHPAWGVVALPLLARLYVRKKDLPGIDPKHRPEFRTKLDMGVELLRWASTLLESLGKPIWVVADGAYASAPFLKPAMALGMTVVSRLRKDAALWSVPKPPRKGQRGRLRIYGPDRISLAKRARQRRGWTTGRFELYGKSTVKRYKTFLAAWIAAAVLYAMYYLAHYSSVERKQLEIGGGHGMAVSSWVQFGGLGFVLETARMNYLAALLPVWCTALYLPLGLFGLAALGLGVGGMRISLATPALYVLLFSVIGRAYNSDWGWLIAPILGFGFSLSPYYLWKYLNVALTNTTEGDRN